MYRDRTLPRLRNVQGRNITKVKECTGTEYYQGSTNSLLYKCSQTSLLYKCTQDQFTVKEGEIQFWGHTDKLWGHTDKHTDICTSRAASSQLKRKGYERLVLY